MEQENITPIGEILKQNRESQKIDLKDISSAINVREAQLEAIESGDIKELPGMVYAIGFVRSYATELGLDSEEITLAFKAEHGTPEPSPAEINIQPSIEGSQTPNKKILAGAAIGIFVLLFGWFMLTDSKENEEIQYQNTIPEVPAHLKVEAEPIQIIPTIIDTEIKIETPEITPDNTNTILTVDTNTIEPIEVVVQPPKKIKKTIRQSPKLTKKQTGKAFGAKKSNSRISLLAKASSWVQVKDKKGDTVFRKVLRPGQVYRVPKISGMTLTTANAGGLEIFIDGKEVAPFGKPGDIIRGIELDANAILRKNKNYSHSNLLSD